MNTEENANSPPLVPVLSDNKSDDNLIGAPQLSEVETLSNYGSPASPILPEPPHSQSS